MSVENNSSQEEIKKAAKNVILKDIFEKDYAFTEAYKELRTNILFSGENTHVIAVTSSLQSEGKSTVSLELSKSLSELNYKVLFVDTDLRKSNIVSRYIKKEDNSIILGLSHFLTGQATLDDIIHTTQNPNLDIILCGHYPPNPVELLSQPKFAEMLVYAKENYDYVIVDTPPLGAVIDAAIIAKNCDGAILVISPDYVDAKIARKVKAQLTKSDCKILGVVMNQVKKRKNNYGYYNQYYGKYYKSYTNDNASENKSKLFKFKKK